MDFKFAKDLCLGLRLGDIVQVGNVIVVVGRTRLHNFIQRFRVDIDVILDVLDLVNLQLCVGSCLQILL